MSNILEQVSSSVFVAQQRGEIPRRSHRFGSKADAIRDCHTMTRSRAGCSFGQTVQLAGTWQTPRNGNKGLCLVCWACVLVCSNFTASLAYQVWCCLLLGKIEDVLSSASSDWRLRGWRPADRGSVRAHRESAIRSFAVNNKITQKPVKHTKHRGSLISAWTKKHFCLKWEPGKH